MLKKALRILMVVLLCCVTILPFSHVYVLGIDVALNGLELFVGNEYVGDDWGMLILFAIPIISLVFSFIHTKTAYILTIALCSFQTFLLVQLDAEGNLFLGMTYDGTGFYLAFLIGVAAIVLSIVALAKPSPKPVYTVPQTSPYHNISDKQILAFYGKANNAQRKQLLPELVQRGYVKRDANGKLYFTGKKPS